MAALPLEVRKGYAFPKGNSATCRGYAPLCGHSPNNTNKYCRKAEGLPQIKRQGAASRLLFIPLCSRDHLKGWQLFRTHRSIQFGQFFRQPAVKVSDDISQLSGDRIGAR